MDELRKHATRMFGDCPVETAFLLAVESELGVALPREFTLACEFLDGSGLIVMPLHALSHDSALNVIAETQRLRRGIDLPGQFLVLGEPPASLLLIDCVSGQVIWCDAIDAERVGKMPLLTPPDIWKSYGHFLAYLLEEEVAEDA